MDPATAMVYVNGSFTPSSGASVSVFDRGFQYGDGLFETFTARSGRPFLFREHMERLLAGAGVLGIPPGELFDVAGTEEKIGALIEMNGLGSKEAVIKIILSRGVGSPAALPAGASRPTIVIMAREADTGATGRLRDGGAGAVLLSHGLSRYHHQGGLKTLNYLPCVLGRAEAARSKAYEGIFTARGGSGNCQSAGPDPVIDTDLVLEGTATNVFIVKDGAVVKTPPPGRILPGITRQAIIGLAAGLSLPVSETDVTAACLRGSNEAFLTNSVIGIAPLVRLDSQDIGAGKAGPVTRRLQNAYYKALADSESSNRIRQESL